MFSYFFWDPDTHIVLRIIQLPINFLLVISVPHYYFVTNSYTNDNKDKIIKKLSYFIGIFHFLTFLFQIHYVISLIVAAIVVLVLVLLERMHILMKFEIPMN